MCYRCNGIGFIGKGDTDADRVIQSYREAPVVPWLTAPLETCDDDCGAWLLALFSQESDSPANA